MLNIKFTEGPPEVVPKPSSRWICGRFNGSFQVGFGAHRRPLSELYL